MSYSTDHITAPVLIIEDDAGLSMLLSEAIEDMGHTPLQAMNGNDALDILEQQPVELMLLDFSLPDMSGLELLDNIDQRGLPLPTFIVATGAGDEHVAVEMMKSGACDYLVKDAELLASVPKAITHALRESESAHKLAVAEERMKLAAQMLESAAEAIMVTDAQYRIQDVNPAFLRITGFTLDEMLNRQLHALQPGHEDDQAVTEAIVDTLESASHWQGEIQLRRKDGAIFTAWLNVSRIAGRSADPHTLVYMFSDISAMKESSERLDYLAHHDPLTGLPNRLLFNARLSYSLERAKRNRGSRGLLFLDLDEFKEVNDSLGHAAEYSLLQTLADQMSALLREEDTLARLAGDEFVLLIEGSSEDANLQRIVSQLLSLFPHRVETPEGTIEVTASIGGAIYPTDANSAEELLAMADKAMYAAKKAGRNRYYYIDRITKG